VGGVETIPVPEENIFLLLIDLKGSTDLSEDDSKRLYPLIAGFVDSVNEIFAEHLHIPMKHSYGDEVSGVFRTPLPCYLAAEEFYSIVRDITGFRYCVAEGSLTFPSADMRKVGGTAFKRANMVMESRLKKKKRRFCEWTLDDSSLSATVTSLVNLCYELKQRMTELQWEVYAGLSNDMTITQIAQEKGHNKNSLYQVNSRSASEVIFNAEIQLQRLLSGYGINGKHPATEKHTLSRDIRKCNGKA